MRRFSAVALATLTCGLVTASALAATDDAVIGGEAGIVVNAGELDGAVVGCPAGETALSGGIVQSGSAADITLRESGPVSNLGNEYSAADGDVPIGWVASVSKETSNAEFNVYVVCADANAKLAVKKFGGEIGESKRVSVECPGARRAVGGGALQFGNQGFDFIRETGPVASATTYRKVKSGAVPKGWRTVIASQEAGDKYKVAAVCAKRTDATMKVATERPSDPGFGIDKGVRCGGGKRALGGGIVHKGAAGEFVDMGATGPLDDTFTTANTTVNDVPKYWYGSIENVFGGAPEVQYKAIAICE